MEIWCETIETTEALRRLNKTTVDVPIDSKYVTMLVMKPSDADDHIVANIIRKAFLDSRFAAKNKIAPFQVNGDNTTPAYIVLLANDRPITDLKINK